MNTDTIFEQAKQVGVLKILNGFNVNQHYKNYECMFHDDEHPSAFITTDGLALCCPVCQSSYDAIDIYMKLSGETDIIKACYSILETDKWTNTYVRKSEGVLNDESNLLKKGYTVLDRLNMIKSNTNNFLKYLETRKISDKVLQILDKNNIAYGTDNLNQPTLVFDENFAIYRHYKANKNFNCGKTRIVEIFNSYLPVVYITEGIYDALTLLDTTASANVICLNSLYNEKKLYELIINNYDKYKNYSFVLALDNDKINKIGTTTSEIVSNNIKYFFKEKGIAHRDFSLLYNSGCKDVNELRQKSLF